MKNTLPTYQEAFEILSRHKTVRVRNSAPRIGIKLDRFIHKIEPNFKTQDIGVSYYKKRWDDIVGVTLSKICEPSKIIKTKQQNCLEIRVAGAYGGLLQHQSQTILDRLNLFCGSGSFHKLKFIQAPLTYNKLQPALKILKPITALEELALAQSLESVENEKLKKTLFELGRAVLQRDKTSLE